MLKWTLFAFTCLFGLAIGSFLNVCIYRLPLGRSIVKPRSACPSCGKMISWYDNIPILSYILLRAKCRECGEPISIGYPLVEALTAALAAGLYLQFGPTVQMVIYFAFCCGQIIIAFVDLDHQIIPDVISLPGIVVGLACSFLLPQRFLESLIGAAAGGGALFAVAFTYKRITGREGMGLGDVKLLAMMGAFLGWKAIPFIILISSLFGTLVGIGLIVLAGKGTKFAIPYGPFLSGAAIAYLFIGQRILSWYMAFH